MSPLGHSISDYCAMLQHGQIPWEVIFLKRAILLDAVLLTFPPSNSGTMWLRTDWLQTCSKKEGVLMFQMGPGEISDDGTEQTQEMMLYKHLPKRKWENKCVYITLLLWIHLLHKWGKKYQGRLQQVWEMGTKAHAKEFVFIFKEAWGSSLKLQTFVSNHVYKMAHEITLNTSEAIIIMTEKAGFMFNCLKKLSANISLCLLFL